MTINFKFLRVLSDLCGNILMFLRLSPRKYIFFPTKIVAPEIKVRYSKCRDINATSDDQGAYAYDNPHRKHP